MKLEVFQPRTVNVQYRCEHVLGGIYNDWKGHRPEGRICLLCLRVNQAGVVSTLTQGEGEVL